MDHRVKCVAAMLAKDEADRYLTPVIQSLQSLCTDVLVLNDGSTDETVSVAGALGAEVRHRSGERMWGKESLARAELWEWGAEVAGDGWLLIADADQEMKAAPHDWRMMLSSWNVNAWAMPLYDCWDSPAQHRADGYWQGYRQSRAWLFRPSACPKPIWPTRGLHCGHAPENFPGPIGLAPPSVYWKHYGWMRTWDRESKVGRYLSAADQLTEGELAHLHSARD